MAKPLSAGAADGVEDFNVTARLGPFESLSDIVKRFKCWVKVLLEWPRLCAVYEVG